MPKLTPSELFWLKDLSTAERPRDWTRHLKATGNKLVRLGLAEYSLGYPIGFVITPAGRAALEAQDE